MSIGWIIFILATLGWHIGMYGMFKKAGIEGWKAFIPFYNTWCMVEKMQLKKYWFFFQFVPIAGQFITIWITIKFVEHFGRFGFWHHAATVLIPFIYFPYMGFSKGERYAGIPVVKNYKKSTAREWIDAAAFAVVAATLIRTFVFEAYTIPSSSMEKTLLVNDFLFVSKWTYGPRLPNTPIAMPFVHHTMPFGNVKSYVEWIELPYIRWFSSPVKRNDAVVFNFPAGDTLTTKYDSQVPYYDLVRSMGRDKVWEQFGSGGEDGNITTRPVDKRENYIKRCVGVSGDTIQIKDGVLFVNNAPAFVSSTLSTFYLVQTENKPLDEDMLRGLGIRLNMKEDDPASNDFNLTGNNLYRINLSAGELEIVKKIPGVTKIIREVANDQTLPYDTTIAKWTTDNFGPLWIPKKGATIQLTKENIAFYQRAIHVYENNTWEEKDGKIFINGKETDRYTFKMDYYWMMGDNRHKSQDSRFWGFVPEDHVVGKASLIFFSWEGGPRWKRLFNWIK